MMDDQQDQGEVGRGGLGHGGTNEGIVNPPSSPGRGGILRYHLLAQRLKHLPAMRETRVGSLGREDPLEKEMVTHSSILAWRIL